MPEAVPVSPTPLTPAQLRRTVSRLDHFQLTAEDWHWLRSLQQEPAAAE